MTDKAKPAAWLHEDGRVVSAHTKDGGDRDGGAMKSSLAGYSAPLYTQAALDAEVAAERERWQQLLSELRSMDDDSVMPDGDECPVHVALWAADW